MSLRHLFGGSEPKPDNTKELTKKLAEVQDVLRRVTLPEAAKTLLRDYEAMLQQAIKEG
jgi:hypothetical protein